MSAHERSDSAPWMYIATLPRVERGVVAAVREEARQPRWLNSTQERLYAADREYHDYLQKYVTINQANEGESRIARSAAFLTHTLLARQTGVASFEITRPAIVNMSREILRKSLEGYIGQLTSVIYTAQPEIDDFLPDYIHELAGVPFPTPTREVQLGLHAYLLGYALIEGQASIDLGWAV